MERGKLSDDIVKQKKLNKLEAKQLTSKLTDSSSYGGETASCFDPHVGIVYYLKGSIAGYVTICLYCNRLYSSIDIPEQKQGKVGSGEEAYYTADGLSPSFRIYLNGLLKKYKFSHQISGAAPYDSN